MVDEQIKLNSAGSTYFIKEYLKVNKYYVIKTQVACIPVLQLTDNSCLIFYCAINPDKSVLPQLIKKKKENAQGV